MKKNYIIMTAICGGLCLGGCSQDAMNNEGAKSHGMQELTIITRTNVPVNEGRVYIMNATGGCIKLLQSDATGKYTSGKLNTGNYEVYAIGSDDLSKFSLPIQSEASASSVISASGETMGDLLTAHQSIALEDGQNILLDMELERKVLKIEEITINEVPNDITGVSVSIAPLYQGVKMNGQYDTASEGINYSTALTKGEGKTWTTAPGVLLFPSKGIPQITVTFSKNEEKTRYVFSPSEALAPNHQMRITGTYSEAQGVRLAGELTFQEWGEEKNVSFDFDEDNKDNTPVAGSTYLGYYVVSVNKTNNTAVLLRRSQENGITSEARMAQRASEINKPEGHPDATWRLPTEAECRIFTTDTYVNYMLGNVWYYCSQNGHLKKLYRRVNSDNTISIEGPEDTDYDADVYYRPVIEITY